MVTIDKEKLLFESIMNEKVHQVQFSQWLRDFFLLNDELHKEYNRIYQKYFYVVFYELTTTGIKFSNKVLYHLRSKKNIVLFDFFNALCQGLLDLKLMFNEKEWQYVKYRRHSASHIFQSRYEYTMDCAGEKNTKQKSKSLEIMQEELYSVIMQHGNDRGFDIYMTSKLYPKIVTLFKVLNAINKKNTSANIS